MYTTYCNLRALWEHSDQNNDIIGANFMSLN